VIEGKTVRALGTADREHVQNLLDCVRIRTTCNAPVEQAHISTSTCLMANVALRTESTLKWDCTAERFTNNDDANRLLHYRYRAPYRLPLPR
jgi:hypothetical protein